MIVFQNVFIDDSSKGISRMIYAKNGNIIENNKKIFKLYEGKIINQEEKINIFEFDEIDFNLADYSSNTIIVAKIQEIPSVVLLKCKFNFQNELSDVKKYNFRCENTLKKEVDQELFKRFYKPLYIPLIALMSCFLIVVPKNNNLYKRNTRTIFLITFLIIVFSEASLRYSTVSNFSSFLYLIIP